MPRLQEGPAPDKNNLNYRTASFSFGKRMSMRPVWTKQDLCPGSNIRFWASHMEWSHRHDPFQGGDIAQAARRFYPDARRLRCNWHIANILRPQVLHYFFYENAAQRRRIVGVVEERQQLAARQRPVFSFCHFAHFAQVHDEVFFPIAIVERATGQRIVHMNLNTQIVAALRGQRERIAGGIISETIADPGELRGQVAKKLFGKAPYVFTSSLSWTNKLLPAKTGYPMSKLMSGPETHKHRRWAGLPCVILFAWKLDVKTYGAFQRAF